MNLQLSLKNKWFQMTKDGIKTEDYREITPYWISRLTMYQNGKEKLDKENIAQMAQDFISAGINEDEIDFVIDNWYLNFKPFDTNTMTLGYPKASNTERILKLEHKGIEIRTGRPEWGAEPNKLYFVIKHGRSLHEA